MYTNYLKVQQTKTGNGVFTTVDISSNTPIIEIRGPIYTDKTLPDPSDPSILQIGPDIFMGATGGPDDMIRHSCNPNCLMHVVGNRAILYSMYVIKAGSELTFDFSATSTDTLDSWNMDCNCGSANCRKMISGFNTLDEETKKKLLDKNCVPIYITHPGLILKRW